MWMATGGPWSWCNAVCGARFTSSNADERIESVLGNYRDRGLRMGWWVPQTSTPGNLAARLEAHGLEFGEPEPVMTCDLIDWEPPRVPPEIEIGRAMNDGELYEWCEAFVDAMQLDGGHAGFEAIYREIMVGSEAPYRTYIGKLEGRVVACGLGVLAGDSVGLFAIGTRPDSQRRGVGSAITARIMADAKAEGARRTMLSSSDEGYPIYERLGFKAVGELAVGRTDFGDSG